MAFDVTALTDYVDENRDGLIGKTVAESLSSNDPTLSPVFKGNYVAFKALLIPTSMFISSNSLMNFVVETAI